MEVTLIAMTDAMYENEPVGATESAEQVCNHAAKTCTKEDAGDLVGQHYIVGKPCLIWEDKDLRPLERALASGHTSVAEHAVYTFEIRGVSRALTHQLVRHRIASYSQQSQRYVNMGDFGSVIPKSIMDNPDAFDDYVNLMGRISQFYEELVSEEGYHIPEEDARYILPNACTTNIVVTMNARELMHFFSLRCCARAQWEIRELATKMLAICKKVSPTLFEDAGPSCVRDGFCRESKSCGRAPKLETMLEIMDAIDCEESIKDEQRTAERECHR